MTLISKKNLDYDIAGNTWCAAPQCNQTTVEGAPVPLCGNHLRATFEFAQDMVNDRWPDAATEAVQVAASTKQAYELAEKPVISIPSWVYFIRKGDLIKIGYSTFPTQRFKALLPDEVLVVIPGTMRDEQRCHLAFAHLREHGEWFRPGPDLLSFIEDLRQQQAA